MWHANDKKSVGRSSPADYEGKRCSAVSYSTGKLGTVNKGSLDERRHFFGTSNSYSHMLAVSLSYTF